MAQVSVFVFSAWTFRQMMSRVPGRLAGEQGENNELRTPRTLG